MMRSLARKVGVRQEPQHSQPVVDGYDNAQPRQRLAIGPPRPTHESATANQEKNRVLSTRFSPGPDVEVEAILTRLRFQFGRVTLRAYRAKFQRTTDALPHDGGLWWLPPQISCGWLRIRNALPDVDVASRTGSQPSFRLHHRLRLRERHPSGKEYDDRAGLHEPGSHFHSPTSCCRFLAIADRSMRPHTLGAG